MSGRRFHGSTARAVWTWTLASIPAIWLVVFGLFVIRARVSLGRWPAPYQPDPKDLGFDLHYAAVLAGMPLMFAAVLTLVALMVFRTGRSGRHWWLPPVVGAAGLAVVLLLANADPGHVFTWLGD